MKYITIENGTIYRIKESLFDKIELMLDNEMELENIYHIIKTEGRYIGEIEMSLRM